ncbi:MarR family winged helix-turn-helix transcriptional regulator [Agreia sp. COWG]|uniref:MarR family winged helix-turn-helix transcriptional regulator n=1 Tax=Agreia sp. COWG TaxID=2773266 RepID=UPI0019283D3D|nr:MarR family transcriptional regulator [Agreia sp. COWG]CAD6005966.1 DNA-binding MarR family transcriptional regulator [Agreia sp. COWG]
MTGTEPASSEAEKYVLDGFPDTALLFFRAMELSRNRVAARHGLSETELRAFFRIAAAGAMTPKQLATDLGLTNGAITGVSNRLVAAGHIRRVDHPRDRRSLHLELTASGHDAMKVMHADFRLMLTPDEDSVPEVDLGVTESALRVLTAQIQAHVPIVP